MKTALVQTIILITLALAFVGCGNGKSKFNSPAAASPSPLPVDPPDGSGGGPSVTWPYDVAGDTVAFVPVSWEEMNSYVGIRPLNDPSNAMVNISLQQVSGLNIFSGTVRIGYTDTGTFYYGEFNVGSDKNVDCKNCQNNGDYEAGYNYWTTINGKKTFMGYFQDVYGSIILVLEEGVSTGDGSGSGILAGRIYYRNFAQSIYPQSPYRKCWYIYSGPYACYSTNMATKSSSTDIDGYRLLGSFSGVQSFKVFQ